MPAAFFLGFLTFFLSFVPLGPPMVWLSAAAWLLYNEAFGWGLFLLGWGFFVVSGVDNVLRPYLISRGSKLPLLLVLFGVLGGLLAFGFLGIFLGPTLLGLGYVLLQEWSSPPQQATTGLGEEAAAARPRRHRVLLPSPKPVQRRLRWSPPEDAARPPDMSARCW